MRPFAATKLIGSSDHTKVFSCSNRGIENQRHRNQPQTHTVVNFRSEIATVGAGSFSPANRVCNSGSSLGSRFLASACQNVGPNVHKPFIAAHRCVPTDGVALVQRILWTCKTNSYLWPAPAGASAGETLAPFPRRGVSGFPPPVFKPHARWFPP